MIINVRGLFLTVFQYISAININATAWVLKTIWLYSYDISYCIIILTFSIIWEHDKSATYSEKKQLLYRNTISRYKVIVIT